MRLLWLCWYLTSGHVIMSAFTYDEDPETRLPREPCSVHGHSFLFTREDVSAGSVLMKLPTQHGEVWTLTETQPTGYLALDKSRDGHSWIIFTRSPDLETISQSSGRRRESLPFVLTCTVREWTYKYKQELIISDVNEHAPIFDLTRSYNTNVTEVTNVGSSVYSLRQLACDPDTTGQVSFYALHPYLGLGSDGHKFFQISEDGSHVVLSQPLDYERMDTLGQIILKLNLSATDNGSPFSLTSFITLTFLVTDVDDQGPAFIYSDCPKVDNFCTLPYFQTAVTCGFQGMLRLYPGPLQALDRDTQNHSIFYSLSRVEPDTVLDKLKINQRTGDIQVTSSLCPSHLDGFVLTVTATEKSPLEHSISVNVEVKLLDHLMFPNMAWNVQVGSDRVPASSSSLSLTLFLVAVFGFLLVGSALTFVAVRILQNKKQNKIRTAGAAIDLYTDDCSAGSDDCSKTTASSKTRTCSHSWYHNDSSRAAVTSVDSLNAASFSPLRDPEPQEMWTAFRTANGNHLLTECSRFNPSPSLPGQADIPRFYDGNASFESMKHERACKDSQREAAVGFKFKVTSVVPDLFKSANQRVRFDTSSLSQSSV